MSWFLSKSKKPAVGKRIVIGIGHSRLIRGKRDGGAVSVGGVQEWDYCLDLAKKMQAQLETKGHEVTMVSDYGEASYGLAAQNLARRVAAVGGDIVLELHFNAASVAARGHEWLYLRGNANAMVLAASINNQFTALLPELPQRGIKSVGMKDRGYQVLAAQPCPAVICEPFFGSNPKDWQIATDRTRMIAHAIAAGACQYLSPDHDSA